MSAIEMVVVNGIRYRPEDAPAVVSESVVPTKDPVVKKRVTQRKGPARKSDK